MKLTNHYLLMAATVAAAMLLNPQRCLADDDLVEAYQFTATTMAGSSVSVILANNNVYSINGQLVRRNADTLDNLPKGIYIVNGKKHIVK